MGLSPLRLLLAPTLTSFSELWSEHTDGLLNFVITVCSGWVKFQRRHSEKMESTCHEHDKLGKITATLSDSSFVSCGKKAIYKELSSLSNPPPSLRWFIFIGGNHWWIHHPDSCRWVSPVLICTHWLPLYIFESVREPSLLFPPVSGFCGHVLWYILFV